MTQLFIAIFGLSSLWMALGDDPRARRWAPVVGLCGQPFWLAFAIETKGWGLGVLVAAYTVVYLRGVVVQWKGSTP